MSEISDNESLENYPLVDMSNKTGTKVMLIPDLICQICDFCEGGELLHLSLSNKYLRSFLMGNERAQKRGYLLTILNYKYNVAASRLENI